MAILEKVKSMGRGVLNKMMQPLLEKPPKRITWGGYGKWRTFSHNDGQVIFRRYRQQPGDAKVVKSAREASELAKEQWGLDVDSRGRLSAPEPVTREPMLSDRAFLLQRRSMIRLSPRPMRITPRSPRLMR